MPAHEPSRPARPRVLPGGRRAGREPTLRDFLRPSIWTLIASVTLVVVTGVFTWLAVRSSGARPGADAEIFRALGSKPLDAPPSARTPVTAPASASAARPPSAFADPATLSRAARAALAIVDRVEGGHANGKWSVVRKRLDPCPGRDTERLGWIDPSSRFVKITATRAGAGSAIAVEQWFDDAGRLRGVRATPRDQAWSLRVLLDESGATVHRDAAGEPPPLEALGVATRDPSAVFFSVPRCDAEKK